MTKVAFKALGITKYSDALEKMKVKLRENNFKNEIVWKTGGNSKNKKQLNSALLVNLIKKNIQNSEEVVIVVEQVNAMPGQGVTSMFNFGQTFGALKGICAALELPIFFVRPSKWKKHFELINSSKDASRTKAIEMYPKISNQLTKRKDVNKSDAILIARFFSETRLAEEN